MERRSKNRHDLQLVCHIGETKVLSATPEQGSRALEAMTAKGAVEATTENMSRDGMLMRWLDGVPLPEIGTILTVEVDLPGGEDFGPPRDALPDHGGPYYRTARCAARRGPPDRPGSFQPSGEAKEVRSRIDAPGDG